MTKDVTDKWYIDKPESVLENGIHEILSDIEIQNILLILVRKQNLVLISKKKRSNHFQDFVVPADNRGSIKVTRKLDKYLDILKGIKERSNAKLTVIPIVAGDFGTLSKGLEKWLW